MAAKRILILDDEPNIGASLRLILEREGYAVTLARTVAESKKINDVDSPAVIISSSGMMEGGRILHHLKRRLPIRSASATYTSALEWDYPFGGGPLGLPGGPSFFSGKHFKP